MDQQFCKGDVLLVSRETVIIGSGYSSLIPQGAVIIFDDEHAISEVWLYGMANMPLKVESNP